MSDAPFRQQFDAAMSPLAARNALGITGTGGGGGGAPTDAEYITTPPVDPALTNARALTDTATVTWDFTTAGQAKANATSTGGVPGSRTITAGAGLTGGGDLSADRTFDVGAGTGITVNANDVALTVPVSVANGGTGSTTTGGALTSLGAQPLDADLTSLAAASATNAIYYRSAANTWGPVTIGGNLSFSGGTLNTAVTPQAQDATLTALAAYNTNGLLTQTAPDTFTGRTLTGPAAGITVANGNGVAGNPTLALANDLAALEALAGTNTIYYRSGSDAWTAVTIGSGLSFTAGTLAASGGGGNVSNSGTPTNGQWARWINANQIEGVSAASTGFVLKTGDTMTGLLEIKPPASGSALHLTKPIATDACLLVGNMGSTATTRWAVSLGTNEAETGSNAGSNFNISRFNDAGSSLGAPVTISRATGVVTIDSANLTGNPVAPTPTAGDNDTSIATTAFVTAADATVSAATIGPPQGRLTLQSTVPVSGTVVGSGIIYYTPYIGNLVPIYDGTRYVMTPFTELSCVLSNTTKNPAAIGASKVNDWFVWDDAGTLRVGHGPDWTNDTTRSAGTALFLSTGVWLNNVAITNGPAQFKGTYVGTTRSDPSSALSWYFGSLAIGGSQGWLAVWNAYNRVDVKTQVRDSTDSWTWAAASGPHAANSSGTMRVYWVCGLAEDCFFAMYACSGNTGTGFSGFGVGYDTSLTFSGTTGFFNTGGTAGATQASFGTFTTPPAIGFHFVNAMETQGVSGTGTFYGDAGFPLQTQNGLTVMLRM